MQKASSHPLNSTHNEPDQTTHQSSGQLSNRLRLIYLYRLDSAYDLSKMTAKYIAAHIVPRRCVAFYRFFIAL